MLRGSSAWVLGGVVDTARGRLDSLPALDASAFVPSQKSGALKGGNDFCSSNCIWQQQHADRAAGVEPRDDVGDHLGSGFAFVGEAVGPCPPLFWCPAG